LDYGIVEPDVTKLNLSATMNFEMEDLRAKREKEQREKSDDDGEHSTASVTEHLDKSVTTWAGVAATWSVT
jgi:hypothetical protein